MALDAQVKGLIIGFKRLTRNKIEITPEEEERRFEHVSSERIEHFLDIKHPDAAFILENIDPKTGKIVYNDTTYGLRTEDLTNLGYQLSEDGVYRLNDPFRERRAKNI